MKVNKMKIFLFLFLCVTTISIISAQQCGLENAGVIIQQLTDVSMSTNGLFYDTEAHKLYFVVQYKPALCVINGKYTNMDYKCTEIPDIKWISAAIPIKNEKNKMIGLADNKLIYLILKRESSGNIVKITTEDIKVVDQDSSNSFIYSKVDHKGRLWIDSATHLRDPDIMGKVLQISKDKSITEIISSFRFPSGMGFSPDNKIFFQVDAKQNVVWKYDFNINTGTIKNPTVIYNLTANINLHGSICSLLVAKDNTLWLGICESGTLVKYNCKTKQLEQVHQLPALYPVSLEFGGLDLNQLFVGTENLHEKDTPAAGAVFVISGTGSTGLASYKLSKYA